MRVSRPTATVVGVLGIGAWTGAALYFSERWWLWAGFAVLWAGMFFLVFRTRRERIKEAERVN